MPKGLTGDGEVFEAAIVQIQEISGVTKGRSRYGMHHENFVDVCWWLNHFHFRSRPDHYIYFCDGINLRDG